jgi:hypothetical protein
MRPSARDTGKGGRTAWRLAVAVLFGLALGAGGAYWLLRSPQVPPLPAPVAGAPATAIETATEAEIDQHVATSLTVFRLADRPRILVLDFASLHQQGEMLNRVAAFVEKAGLPHDRVLSDGDLSAAIQSRGDTVETFYFGHDYAASSLARFFALADSGGIRLNPEEERLRALLRQENWFAPGVTAGLISVPAVGSEPRITASVRSAILRHELSHGEFFSNPEYAAYVHNFWLTKLTGDEREAVRRFLGSEGYDAADEELMYNEMQAYLMFTRDPLFFTPDLLGMTQERLSALQVSFLSDMPAGWLRDLLGTYVAATSAR